jgi:glutamate carboxypeptidase
VDTVAAPGSGVEAAELERLRSSIQGALPAYLADLERLVNTDCGSYTPAGVDEIGRFVAERFERLGFDVDVRPDPNRRLGATVIGTRAGAVGDGPRLLLIGHMDTVFDPGTVAERPFRIDDDGMARGPGVTDMKSGLLAGLYALEALVAGGDLPFERVTYIANPDEEIGSPSSTPHIKAAAASSDVCLVLECARANGDFVASRKGTLHGIVTLHGRAAHAGVEPEKGRSAILAAADLTVRLHALNGRWPGVTVNVGVINGGTRPNVVAEQCLLEFDVRAVRREDLEAASAAVHELLSDLAVPDVTFELTEKARWNPMERLERSGRLADHVVALAQRLGFETTGAVTGGASDANTTSGMGVPSIDGLGPVGGLDHSPGEYLEVGSIVPRTALLAALILEIGRDPVVRGWRDEPA